MSFVERSKAEYANDCELKSQRRRIRVLDVVVGLLKQV